MLKYTTNIYHIHVKKNRENYNDHVRLNINITHGAGQSVSYPDLLVEVIHSSPSSLQVLVPHQHDTLELHSLLMCGTVWAGTPSPGVAL